MTDQQMSIIEHLEALRRALMISMLSVIPGAVAGWFIREEILKVLVRPVAELQYKLVYITATEAFKTELKIALFAGIAIASPMIAYQIWKFILPALHAHEKRYILFFVPVSVVLFITGIVFGYYSVFLYGVKFLLNFAGEELVPMLSLGSYMSFSLWFLLPFGLIFELPLLILLLVGLGILTPQFLSSKRKWVLVISFVLSAVVTPTTDIFTQGTMALAVYLLYEISIWISYLVGRKGRRMALPGTDRDGIDETDE
ncbi:MAG: twin-arginine translocase subunit TatC [Thermincola sp.]|jgi:sec-independent protein translocase protein TatC|nr:twin-arginine translocase subunit TatC [Thermincola sp.]MDT3703970.1 twin-arginine translocase subunit TatC [Thermincola sp.]